ncbi:hypothetical protein F5X97DRAFT_306292 [Nemania serpens]|nr:hypothetical protein F5X97DRAFT_306292 [Nemania serpens]
MHQYRNQPLPKAFQPEWRWPWWKFGLEPDDIFTTLRQQFNTTSFAIQDPTSFLLDIREIAERCETKDEFFTGMAERRDQRTKELEEAWAGIGCYIAMSPNSINCECRHDRRYGEDSRAPDHWWDFLRLSRSRSLDSLVNYFDGYIRHLRLEQHKIRDERKRARSERQNRTLVTTDGGEDVQMRQADLQSTEPATQSPLQTVESTAEALKQPVPDIQPAVSTEEQIQPQSKKRSPPEEGDATDSSVLRRDEKRQRLSQDKCCENEPPTEEPSRTTTHADISKGTNELESDIDNTTRPQYGTENPSLSSDKPEFLDSAKVAFNSGEQSSLSPQKDLLDGSDC